MCSFQDFSTYDGSAVLQILPDSADRVWTVHIGLMGRMKSKVMERSVNMKEEEEEEEGAGSST